MFWGFSFLLFSFFLFFFFSFFLFFFFSFFLFFFFFSFRSMGSPGVLVFYWHSAQWPWKRKPSRLSVPRAV
ncbi:MAG: hypothetical protein EBZ77_09900 [Chitinophagia bacterium]|nr:hypothetical protein [Chitinophagia bacterium]